MMTWSPIIQFFNERLKLTRFFQLLKRFRDSHVEGTRLNHATSFGFLAGISTVLLLSPSPFNFFNSRWFAFAYVRGPIPLDILPEGLTFASHRITKTSIRLHQFLYHAAQDDNPVAQPSSHIHPKSPRHASYAPTRLCPLRYRQSRRHQEAQAQVRCPPTL